jgi:hypothetical protein
LIFPGLKTPTSGPGAAGILVGAAGAPIAILIDAVTYLVSAMTLLFIRRSEPEPQPDPGLRKSLWAQIGYGLRLSVSNIYLRALGTEAAIYNLFNQMLWAVLILHLARGMHFQPVIIGLVLTTEGVGALLGSLVAARLSRRWGLGRTLIGSIMVANAAPLLIPAAPSGWALAAPLGRARRPDWATRHHGGRRNRHALRHVFRHPIADSQAARSL